jgi:D-alanyl-D-alanine carboxypeptidase
MTSEPRIQPPHRKAAVAGGAAALAAIFAMALPATGVAAPAHRTPEPAGAKLQAIVDQAVSSPATTFPGAALTVRRPGHTARSVAAGKARIAPAVRMRAGDRVRAGSIAKPFVAAATLQLVEQGKFALDDRLPAVLPASVTARFPEAGRITVRMLLNHTSGLADFNDDAFYQAVVANPLRRWSVTELLDRAAALPPASAPGERFAYSNTNYTLLGLVIERATGRSWRTVVRERVIERLGLEHTSLPAPGRTVGGSGIAHAYEPVDGALRDFTDVDSSMSGAAGGHALLTTTADLTRFVDGLFAGRLFERRGTLRQMTRFVPASDPDGLTGYGLGLERYRFPGGVEVIGHLGTTAGYRVLAGRLPAQRATLAMAITTPDDPTPVLAPALELLAGGS